MSAYLSAEGAELSPGDRVEHSDGRIGSVYRPSWRPGSLHSHFDAIHARTCHWRPNQRARLVQSFPLRPRPRPRPVAVCLYRAIAGHWRAHLGPVDCL